MDDFSWLVGIIEGEGCISISRHNKTEKSDPVFEVAMTDEDVIQKVAHLLNHEYRSYVPPGRTVDGQPYKTAHKVKFQGRKAMAIIDIIYPHMSSRRQKRIDEVREAYSPKLSCKTEGYTPRPKTPVVFNF